MLMSAALSCPVLPCPALPCRAVPCHALPSVLPIKANVVSGRSSMLSKMCYKTSHAISAVREILFWGDSI